MKKNSVLGSRLRFVPTCELLEDRRAPSDALLSLVLGPAWLVTPLPEAQPPQRRGSAVESASSMRAVSPAERSPASESFLFLPPRIAEGGPKAAPALTPWRMEPEDLRQIQLFDGPTIQGPSFEVSANAPANNREICDSGRGRLQNETAIAVYGNVVIVGYNDSRGWPGQGCPTQAPGYQISGWAYSLDYGATFTDGGPLPGGVDMQGDPWLAVVPDGTIYYAGLWRGVSGLTVLRGTVTEKGVVWADAPAVLTGSAGGPTWDKEAIAVDPNTGYVYLTYTRFGGPGGIHLYRSFDQGETFEGPIPIATGGTQQGSQAVVGPNGEVYVMWTNRAGAPSTGVGFAVSYDFGKTFTRPREIAPMRNVPVLGADRASPFGHLAIDRSGGKYDGSLYITYHSSHATPSQNEAYLLYSRDGGENWSEPILINDDFGTGPQWWPTVSVDDYGFVNVFYYDRRNDPTSRDTEMYFAQSRDGGETFLPSFPVTEYPTTWGGYSEGGFTITGDYIRSTSQWGDNYVAYVDHRDVDPDVYVTRVSTLT